MRFGELQMTIWRKIPFVSKKRLLNCFKRECIWMKSAIWSIIFERHFFVLTSLFTDFKLAFMSSEAETANKYKPIANEKPPAMTIKVYIVTTYSSITTSKYIGKLVNSNGHLKCSKEKTNEYQLQRKRILFKNKLHFDIPHWKWWFQCFSSQVRGEIG